MSVGVLLESEHVASSALARNTASPRATETDSAAAAARSSRREGAARAGIASFAAAVAEEKASSRRPRRPAGLGRVRGTALLACV